jgi:pantothenate kinase
MIALHTLEDIVKWLAESPPHRVLGIVGPPGSGKSTLAEELSSALPIHHTVVPMDGFHYPQDTLRALGRRDRMGASDTFDADGLAELLTEVAHRDKDVVFPEFDRTIEEPVPGSIVVSPDDELIILEGNYLLVNDETWGDIGAFLDLSLYVDIPEEVRIARLIDRHVRFGKNRDDATEWVHRVDQANARVIEATKHQATALYKPLA